MFKNVNLDKTFQFLLIILAFLMPLTVFGGNLIIVIICFLWLFSGNYKSKFNQIINNKLMIASILFFFIHVVGLIWTEDLSWGLHIVHKMWYFIGLFPILYTIVRKDYISHYISAFLLAISITEVCSYLVWFEIIEPFKNATVENPTPFMSHVSYNPILAFAIYLVLHEVFFNKKLKKIELFAYSFFSISMSFNMFITGGRAGQVMFFAALIILSFQYFKDSQVKAIIISLVLSISISIIAYSSSDIFKGRIDTTISNVTELDENKITSIGYRITFLINSFELIKNNPILGVGTGDFPNEYEKINLANSPKLPATVQPHNMYLLILAQLGIFGLISLLWIFYTQFKIALKSNNHTVRNIGVAMPIFFLIIMWSDSYLLGHFTSNLFILFSSFIYSNRLNV